jgi:hypothetical protein
MKQINECNEALKIVNFQSKRILTLDTERQNATSILF